MLEVDIVCHLVRALCVGGVDVRKGGGLGIISPYRSQVRALKESLSLLLNQNIYQNQNQTQNKGKNLKQTELLSVSVPESNLSTLNNNLCDTENMSVPVPVSECDVSTVDSFQGRDMDAIIFSTVKNLQGSAVSNIHHIFLKSFFYKCHRALV